MNETLQTFLARGWEEAGLLGIGARGSVLQIKRKRDSGPHTSKQYALKCSTSEEIKALKALSHCKSVVCLEEHVVLQGQVWARLELCEGGTIRDHLRSLSREGLSLPEHQARFFIGEVLKGLDEIHRRRWMHRDIKAENIGLTAPMHHDGRVKLLDFDSAVAIPQRGKLSQVVGTAENMAPEVFEGAYDERADCWSVGVLTHELVFGYRPFNDPTLDGVEEMIRNWREYLVLPSGISDVTADFLKGLLAGCEERNTSAEAARHDWLRGNSGNKSRSMAASPPMKSRMAEQTRPSLFSINGVSKMSTGAKDKVTSRKLSSPNGFSSSPNGFSPPRRPPWGAGGGGGSPERTPPSYKTGSTSGLLAPSSPRRRDTGSMQTSPKKSYMMSSTSQLDDSDTVNRLIRMRRSLSEWGQNFGWSSPRTGLEDPALRMPSSLGVPSVFDLGSAQTEASVEAPQAPRSMNFPDEEPPPLRSSKSEPLKNSRSTPAANARSASSWGDADDADHSAFLEQTRARTQEILRHQQQLAREAAMFPATPATATTTPTTATSKGRQPTQARSSDTSRSSPRSDIRCSSPRGPQPSDSRINDVVDMSAQVYLQKVKLKTQDLLKQMSLEAEKSAQPSPGMSLPGASAEDRKENLQSVHRSNTGSEKLNAATAPPLRLSKSDITSSANTASASPVTEVTEEPREPISPRSYLLKHKSYTQQLLAGMQHAAAAAAVGSPQADDDGAALKGSSIACSVGGGDGTTSG